MKQTLYYITLLALLAGCRGGVSNQQPSAQNIDTAALVKNIETAIMAEIQHAVQNDSVKYNVFNTEIQLVDRKFVDKHILTQTEVYRSMYRQKSEAAIAAGAVANDSTTINRTLAARYLDTVKMYEKLENSIKNNSAPADENIYYARFHFVVNSNGQQLPEGVAGMFFDKNYKPVEASAPKLIK